MKKLFCIFICSLSFFLCGFGLFEEIGKGLKSVGESIEKAGKEMTTEVEKAIDDILTLDDTKKALDYSNSQSSGARISVAGDGDSILPLSAVSAESGDVNSTEDEILPITPIAKIEFSEDNVESISPILSLP